MLNIGCIQVELVGLLMMTWSNIVIDGVGWQVLDSSVSKGDRGGGERAGKRGRLRFRGEVSAERSFSMMAV